MAVTVWAVAWGAWALAGASFAGWALVGALAWTLAEYALHRLDMHGRRSRGASRREHLRHHATVDVPALTADTWLGAAMVAVALAWWGRVGLGVGWMAAYVGYELLHRSLHTADPPTGTNSAAPTSTDAGTGTEHGARLGRALGAPRRRHRRWALGHHLHHHHVDARRNYGVTTPLWDHAFGTYARPRSAKSDGKPVGGKPAGGQPAGQAERLPSDG